MLAALPGYGGAQALPAHLIGDAEFMDTLAAPSGQNKQSGEHQDAPKVLAKMQVQFPVTQGAVSPKLSGLALKQGLQAISVLRV